MNNNTLKEAYNTLSAFYDDYWILMHKKAKSNKSGPRSIESQIDIIRDKVKHYIEGNTILIDYIEFPDEFFSYLWFEQDFKSLLIKLKDAYETI